MNRVAGVVAAMVVMVVVCSIARGEDPAPEAPAAVAMVLGDPISAEAVDAVIADAVAQGMTAPDRGDVVLSMVLEPLIQRYIEAHNLRVTDAEVDAFLGRLAESEAEMRSIFQAQADEIRAQLDDPALDEMQRAELAKQLRSVERQARGEKWPDAAERAELAEIATAARAALAGDTLSDEEKANLRSQIQYADRYAGLDDAQAAEAYRKWEREIRREIAAPMIEWWKFNRSMFKEHGGRVLFQQGGLEAFDAMKVWLEEREQAGDFAILDPLLKDGFWAYYTRDHGVFLNESDGTEFDAPWWEQGE